MLKISPVIQKIKIMKGRKMNNKFFRKTKRLISGVIAAAMAAAMLPVIPAKAEDTVEKYPYTMFAGSNEDGAITVNAGKFCVNGNVATNGTISASGNMNINGAKKEKANEEMIYIFKKLNYTYFTGENVDVYPDDYIYKEMNININDPMDVKGDLELTGNINLSTGIKALDNVMLNGEVKNTNNSAICSETGDIIIDSQNVNLNGLVYAPYGDVEITAQNLNLNNVIIIADTITFNCPSVNANYSSSMAELVGTESDIDVELFAFGEYNEEAKSIDIEWYTNYTNSDSDYELMISDDNVSYSSVATVTGATTYQYLITEDFETRYFKITLTNRDGEVIESTPFEVIKKNNTFLVTIAKDCDKSIKPEVVTPYVLYSLGNSGSVYLNATSLSVFGNISSTNSINIKSKKVECFGNNTENDNGFIFDSLSTLNKEIPYSTDNHSNIIDNCVISKEYNYTEYNCYADYISWTGKMFADNNIKLNSKEIISGDNVNQLIESKNGSIEINCNNFNYKGLIYAPSGTVTINANQINFSGIIIANEIKISGFYVTINENNTIFSYYNSIEQNYQKENDKIIDKYVNAVEELKNDPNNNDKKSNYESLRKQLKSRSLLLSNEEKFIILGNNSENTVSTVANLSFKPCNGIENMYDVIRRSSVYPYKGKSYQYYSITVTDKYSAKNPKFTRNYSPNLYLLGNCKDEKAANKILNQTFQTVFGSGLGSILTSSGHKVSGTIVKKVIGSFSPFGAPSPHDLYTTSKNFFRLTDVSVNTTMKYYWVNYKGKWEFAYSCDKTKWKYTFTFGKLNSKTRLYDYKSKSCSFTNNGNFYKPYMSIKAIVDYKKKFGDKSKTGNYDPYGYSMTKTYCIKNSNGKTLKTFKPQFIKNTIGLM